MKLALFVVYRPNDSRMLVALGESYEKLNSMQQAKKVSNTSLLLQLAYNYYDEDLT